MKAEWRGMQRVEVTGEVTLGSGGGDACVYRSDGGNETDTVLALRTCLVIVHGLNSVSGDGQCSCAAPPDAYTRYFSVRC